MAFIQYDDISIYLPNGHNQGTVERQLRMIGRMFANCGLHFEPDYTDTKKFPVTNEAGGSKLFYFNYLKSVSSVVQKHEFTDSTTTLVEGNDYTLLPPADDFSKGIELQCVLDHPYYLEVTGTYGFIETIDVSSNDDTVKAISEEITDVVVDYLILLLDNEATGGTRIIRSKTGNDSDVQWSERDARRVYHTPSESPELQALIRKYSC